MGFCKTKNKIKILWGGFEKIGVDFQKYTACP